MSRGYHKRYYYRPDKPGSAAPSRIPTDGGTRRSGQSSSYGPSAPIGITPTPSCLQIAGTLLDHPRTQLHLKGRPPSVASLHHSIHFEPSVLPVVEDLGIGGLGVYAEVADDQRLEEESEELEVPEQSVGIGTQRGHGQGWINEVADGRLRRTARERRWVAHAGWFSTIMILSRALR